MTKQAQGYEAEDFVAGVPSSLILGILAGAVTTVAVTVGFLPAVFGLTTTAAAVGTAVFIAELVKVAYENKNS